MISILCYGDSNTWGCIPGILTRYPAEVRWTGILQRKLGTGYHIIEDGINGRTTVWDDPVNQCRNGLAALGYSLYRAKPLDLVVLMLGTNDLNYTDAEGYYLGIKLLCQRILKANISYPGTSKVFPEQTRLLLVSPINATENTPSYTESCQFAAYTEKAADELGIPWLDAAQYARPSPLDGCHMEAKDHAALGHAIYNKILEILTEDYYENRF